MPLLSPDDVLGLIAELQQEMAQAGHLRASEISNRAFAIDVLLKRLLKLREIPAPPADDDSDAAALREPTTADRFDTLTSQATVETFGRPDVVCIHLPAFLVPPFTRPSISVFTSLGQWNHLRKQELPDHLAASDPAASDQLPVPRQRTEQEEAEFRELASTFKRGRRVVDILRSRE